MPAVLTERAQTVAVAVFLGIIVTVIAVVLSTHHEAKPPAAPTPSGDLNGASADPTGSVHFVEGPNDVVFRVRMGNCRESGGPKLELTANGGWTFRPIRLPQVDDGTGVSASSPSISSIASIDIRARRRFVVAGTDSTCRLRTYTTDDAGLTWQQHPFRRNSWYIDAKSGVPYSPKGAAFVDCPGIADLAGFTDEKATAYCTDGSVYRSSDAHTWKKTGETDGNADATFFDEANSGYAVIPDDKCKSRVYRTRNGGASWQRRGCVVDDLAMPGLGGSVDRLYAGGTGPVWVSTDGGQTWDRPENPANANPTPIGKRQPSASESESPSPSESPSASESP